MEVTLTVNSEIGTAVIQLRARAGFPTLSGGELVCRVQWRGQEYRGAVAAPEAEAVLALLTSARIAPFAGGAMGLDGESCELKIEDGGTRAVYSWWMSPPKEWKPLDEIVGWLRGLGFRTSGQYLP